MRHWNRTVLLSAAELAEYLQTEIKRRWPEGRYPFHIEVLGYAISTQLEVRVWNREGVHVVKHASPEAFVSSRFVPNPDYRRRGRPFIDMRGLHNRRHS